MMEVKYLGHINTAGGVTLKKLLL